MSEWRDFRLLLASTLLTSGSFGLLLPVVPLWAQAGGAAPAGVGATNATFLLTTVAAQVGAPRVLRLLGHREALGLGALLFGLPVFAYVASSWLPGLIVISGLRGIGFAWIVVTGSALVAHLLPAYRRGRGLGQLGLSIGLPNVLCLPAGPWLSQQVSFPVVFMISGTLPLVGAGIAFTMRVRTKESRQARRDHARSDGRRSVRPADLAAPFAVMCSAALASSAYVTFLPAAVDAGAAATVGLLGYSVGALAGRWFGGVFGDRYRRPVLLVPGVALSALGVFALVLVTGTDVVAVAVTVAAAGGLVFGLGFGAVQNTTLTAMFDRVSSRGYDAASTVWNMGFDSGIGIGSLALGVLAGIAGYPVTFGVAAALLVLALPLAVPVSRRERGRES